MNTLLRNFKANARIYTLPDIYGSEGEATAYREKRNKMLNQPTKNEIKKTIQKLNDFKIFVEEIPQFETVGSMDRWYKQQIKDRL